MNNASMFINIERLISSIRAAWTIFLSIREEKAHFDAKNYRDDSRTRREASSNACFRNGAQFDTWKKKKKRKVQHDQIISRAEGNQNLNARCLLQERIIGPSASPTRWIVNNSNGEC